MKAKHLHGITFGALALVMPAAADVIYSNLQNLGIPVNFDGLYLDVNSGNSNTSMASPVAGWDINPFYGGMFVQNSPGFQPVRTTTGNTSAIVNLAVGTSVGSGSTYSSFTWDHDANSGTAQVPGYGTSQMLTTSGGNFTAGTEGYLGFKLYTDATYTAANFGWMRVVLTNNAGGAVIKDWAYDTGGAAIATANVLQNGTTVTLDSAFGSFTLGSQITGANSVVKTGAGTATLTANHSYDGTTTVSQGSLVVNGSISGLGAVTVASGATLGGTGSVSGAVTIDGGILSPGASIESLSSGSLTFNGGTFDYEMDSAAVPSVAADFQKVIGDLDLTGTVNLNLADLAGDLAVAFAGGTTLSLIKYSGEWNHGFFTCGGNELANHEVFSAGLNTWIIRYDATSGGQNFLSEYGSGGHFITLTAIPEPGSWLALGCLVGSGTFLRSRRRR